MVAAPNLSSSGDWKSWLLAGGISVGGGCGGPQPNPAHAQRKLCVLIRYLHSPIPNELQHDTCP